MLDVQSFVEKQKIGARFVLSAQMLGMPLRDFDQLAQQWIQKGGPGFVADGIPFRKVENGEFFIQRLTLKRLAQHVK
ncbi:hypothetical protein [Undibacterium fentianense]|uniref:Uncharacterized protein n=1 Tax=Undibacterium fentianense TaxID=2828728 RepID=A0A941IF12_9BURK|nr:hypothetical protein [Undibacterium fentianense]MBR7801708.1 hypothetical protein [Undibacterium fentianense]